MVAVCLQFLEAARVWFPANTQLPVLGCQQWALQQSKCFFTVFVYGRGWVALPGNFQATCPSPCRHAVSCPVFFVFCFLNVIWCNINDYIIYIHIIIIYILIKHGFYCKNININPQILKCFNSLKLISILSFPKARHTQYICFKLL